MPAKFRSFEDLLKPDPKYKNKMMGKFINCLMEGGKKSTAQRIFYAALEEVHKKVTDKDPQDIFTTAVNNVMPVIEVRSRRVGGATYQVPVPVPQKRRVSLAYRWLLGAARSKKGRPMAQKLADEFYNAFRGEGEAMKKRDDVHKMAEANKAFAHLAY
jgi:small subunit ribosomal protein S7